MLATALIVFREILEAALIISIVMAATKGVQGRVASVGYGLLAGIAGAALVASFAGAISQMASGMGQEVFNATVMFVAASMLAWHSVWMGRHGREMAQTFNAVGKDVSTGSKPLYALAIVVGAAVLREGSEVVLFLYGIAAGGANQAGPMAVGGAIGLVGGIALGLAMYHGLLRVPTRHLFVVTTWMIILLAAGMTSQGVEFLVRADIISAAGPQLWDTSDILTDHSLLGQALHTLVGYTARPSALELAVYVATLVTIGLLTKLLGRPPAPAMRTLTQT